MKRRARAIAAGVLLASVAAPIASATPVSAAPGDPLTVNIFHLNDSHSHLQPEGGSADLGTSGGEFDYELGGWPRVQTQFAELRAAHAGENNVSIHAGDALTGTLFYTLFGGEAEAAMMNHTCFDIFELGNHEFDSGDGALAEFLDFLNDPDDTCETDTLAANVIPAPGTPLNPDPDPAVTDDDYLKPYVVKDFGVDQVGFIGLDIANKTMISSSPLETTEFLDEVETAQKYVDELAAEGVENIVLVTHYQYANDLALAEQVSGVDAIIGGDSHTLLGDFDAFGLEADGPYPTMTTNADGDPVCVVQAWQYSAIVGEISLDFENGALSGCAGTPHLMVGEFTRDDAPVEGAELTEITDAIDAIPTVSIVEPDPDAQALLDTFAGQVDELAAEIIGTSDQPLCLNRLPGDTRSAGICTTDQVSPAGARADVNGGFMQQIVTDAFLARAFRADLALQNAGGVRIALPEGEISIADAYEILPFANTLVEVELSGAEILSVLESAVSNFVDSPDGSDGAYPYGSLIRWDVDLSQPNDERFSNVEVRERDGDEWAPIDPERMYTVVTNSFLMGGGDGYTEFKTAFDEGRFVDTGIDYAQGFIDWITEDMNGEVTVPPASEFSTRSFVGVDGELFAPTGPARLMDTRAPDGDTVGTTIDGEFAGTGAVEPGTPVELSVGGRAGVPPTANAAVLNVTATGTTGPGYVTVRPCADDAGNVSSVNYTTAGATVANSMVTPLSDDGTVCVSTGAAGADVIIDVTGWSAGSEALADVEPARLVDTRSGDTGPVEPGEPLVVPVVADATAVALNVTAIAGEGAGYVTAYPCDGDVPLASSVNFRPGEVAANGLVVPVADDGTVCIAAGASAADVVIDITGAIGATDELVTLTPTRFLDSRAPDGDTIGVTFDGEMAGIGQFAVGEAVELPLAGRGEGDGLVPATSRLALVNLTVTGAEGPGYLTAWDCAGEAPVASTINYFEGQTIANSVIVPVSSDGSVCIVSGGSAAHVIADVSGAVAEAPAEEG